MIKDKLLYFSIADHDKHLQGDMMKKKAAGHMSDTKSLQPCMVDIF